ncbi:MAG: xylulokinase [Bacillota bacterium]
MQTILIGLDLGTSGVRVLAVDERGEVVAQAAREYPLAIPRPGWTEQEPADWWSGTAEALRSVTDQLGERTRKIAAVGLTGQMHGSVFLDGRGDVVRPALLWNDQRTVAECEEMHRRVGAERLMAITGNPALPGFTAPKILWLRNHEPEHFARTARVLLPKDYIRYRLTGAVATDMADGSGMVLLDLVHRRWSAEVLDALDLPASLLPDLFEGTEVTGRVTSAGAAATGLPEGTPVVAGGGDQAAGAVGLGLVREGRVSCSIGTSGVVFAACDRPLVHPEGRLHAFCHAVPGRWHVMGVMLSAAGSFRWLRENLFPGRSYDDLTAMAAGVAPGAEGLLFLPYLTGERTPHMDPYARGAFIGLGLHHSPAHLVRAVLEGITLGLADSLDLVRGLGVGVPEVRLTGGGARSALWRSMLAAAFGAPVAQMAVDEGPAFGAAVLAAVGAGLYADCDAASDAMVRVSGQVTEPDPALAERYGRLHGLYRQAYLQAKPLFPQLSSQV